VFYIALSLIILMIIYAIFFDNTNCPSCGNRMTLLETKDKYGFNLSKKWTISFVPFNIGGRYTALFYCQNCNKNYQYTDRGQIKEI